jgi:predicted transposase YbfD/YdcC
MKKNLIDYLSEIPNPRTGNHQLHNLLDILVIAITATICGADTWTEMEEFADAREEWFARILELPNGIPSHDTMNRVFSLLRPEKLEQQLLLWTQEVHHLTAGRLVAIDGKTVRRTQDKSKGQRALHLVQAWSCENQMVLGQRKVSSKTNEITVIPELLEMLMVKGCVVTIDAMGCQREIAEKIISQEADYVLAVKGNQNRLYEDIQLFFESPLNDRGMSYKTVEKDHGRREIRRYWLTSEIDFLETKGDWMGLKGIGMVESERHDGEKVTKERRYYITSLPSDVKTFAQAVRRHWSIENEHHWVLDMAFREDEQRTRMGYSAENAALLRRFCLLLLKQEKTLKRGIKTKRLKASWSDQYLLKILSLAFKS